mmetsp:Transcript_35077/g.48942  ORF Transcript_35077/g.48942 Transcript_35077/m.48942 type:complete len:298 (-) Transcript_35077:231-1124(-)
MGRLRVDLLDNETQHGNSVPDGHGYGGDGLEADRMVEHVDEGSDVSPHAYEVQKLELVIAHERCRHHSQDHQDSGRNANNPEGILPNICTLLRNCHCPMHNTQNEGQRADRSVDAPGSFSGHPHKVVHATLEEGPHDREHGGNARSDASRPHGLGEQASAHERDQHGQDAEVVAGGPLHWAGHEHAPSHAAPCSAGDRGPEQAHHNQAAEDAKRPIVQHLRVREALGLWWRGGRRDAIAACNTHELRAALSQAPEVSKSLPCRLAQAPSIFNADCTKATRSPPSLIFEVSQATRLLA